MYCKQCGNKLSDGSIFCSACGTKIYDSNGNNNETSESARKSSFVGEVKKCPVCGEILRSTDVECPSCGAEINGRKAAESVKNFVDKILLMDDEQKKVEAIKMYPIPNNKEDISEFMFLAVMNCNAKECAFNKDPNNLSLSWYSKIEQCYKKAKMMFRNPIDLQTIEEQYNQINDKILGIRKKSKAMLTAGILSTIIGTLLFILPVFISVVLEAVYGQLTVSSTISLIISATEYISIFAFIPIGILLIVFNKKLAR